MLFYTFGLFMSLPVLTQYVYFRVSKFKGFPYNISETSEKGCVDDSGGNSSLKELEKEVCTSQSRPGHAILLLLTTTRMRDHPNNAHVMFKFSQLN